MIYAFSIGFLEVGWVDIIDIGLVSILLYQVYRLMRGSVAVKIFLGVLSLYLIYLIVSAAQMELLGTILGQFMGYGVLAAIILFQPEIRKFLLLIGKSTDFKQMSNIRSFFKLKKGTARESFNVTPVIEAVKVLGGSNTGALMVFSRDSELKFYAESGDAIEALLSKRLLLSIFSKNSPLHDGAVVIYQGRIKAARCVLPVSESDRLPAQFGLRHRAALGMSEVTDTLILVVSEESGQFSVARNGEFQHNLSPQEIRKYLNDYLTYDQQVESEKPKESTSETSIFPKEANAGF